MDRERHRQTAGDEDRGIGSTQRDVELVAGDGESVWIPGTVDRISSEQTAEEQYLGDQKHPHAQRGGLALLPQILEVVRQRRMVMPVLVTFMRDGVSLRQHGPPPSLGIRTPPRSRLAFQ